ATARRRPVADRLRSVVEAHVIPQRPPDQRRRAGVVRAVARPPPDSVSLGNVPACDGGCSHGDHRIPDSRSQPSTRSRRTNTRSRPDARGADSGVTVDKTGDTIVALATAAGRGALAIVRMSGSR